jgi:uncharacterized phosphosugar-binding protein
MFQTYLNDLQEKLEEVICKEGPFISQAAHKITNSILDGGIVHLFGCGHSHLLTEEVFYRAGGLAPIHPILVEPLMLHEGAVRSSQFERKSEFAKTFMEDQDIRPGEVVIVISTSGKNPVPIDVALIAKSKGAFVIGLTSVNYSKGQSSRHSSGKFLYEVVDLVIDNRADKGDASQVHEKVNVPFGPTSTVIGAAIINAIFAGVIGQLADLGHEPPIFLSGNIEGADKHNARLVQKYADRIPLLALGEG